MSIDIFFMPFEPIFEWMRNYNINLFGFEFTFMDVFVFSMLASIVMWFVKRLLD